MEKQPDHESPRSLAIRTTLASLKKVVTQEVTQNEVLLPETKMRILEAIRVEPKDVLMATLDESVAYSGEETDLQTRDFLMRRIMEKAGPTVAQNKIAKETEAFKKFLQRTVIGIHA